MSKERDRCQEKYMSTRRYFQRKRCQEKDISEKEISRENIGREEQLKPKCLLQGGSEERGLQ
jgi:hypothetical protein